MPTFSNYNEGEECKYVSRVLDKASGMSMDD